MQADFDVLGIGNAIVDVIAAVEPGFIAANELAAGSMRLVDTAEAEALYGAMPPGIERSGGSAANTCVGVTALGGHAAFAGKVAADQLGDVFARDIRAAGVAFDSPAATTGEPTARCLILVTPDAQRTMSTFLGAAQGLAHVDAASVRAATITYLEGYLWDPETPRAAMRSAASVARAAGRQVAFSLSDSFCVERHRAGFLSFLPDVDLLFANEAEACALFETDDLGTALDLLSTYVPLAAVTRGAKGAVIVAGGERIDIAAEPVARVVDTTGAGDLFAAGFLLGHAREQPIGECGTLGAVAAAEIISHMGARPEADLAALARARLG